MKDTSSVGENIDNTSLREEIDEEHSKTSFIEVVCNLLLKTKRKYLHFFQVLRLLLYNGGSDGDNHGISSECVRLHFNNFPTHLFVFRGVLQYVFYILYVPITSLVVGVISMAVLILFENFQKFPVMTYVLISLTVFSSSLSPPLSLSPWTLDTTSMVFSNNYCCLFSRNRIYSRTAHKKSVNDYTVCCNRISGHQWYSVYFSTLLSSE
uniref:Uncharacterized protein n=1 Tax=Trichobilharzia regenti TaxID=157069 RepID=A0AA85J3E2_TRIRE|nr:unnamed protein product [Trichobilharzia regenti]